MDNSGDSGKTVEDSTSQKKEPTVNLQKICLVCGDKALGYNFNAISCESCKAFFRRNALATKEFKCPFSNNCEINVVTRRFCQKCRLEKCLAIGMVKEFIMSDEDKAEKRRKIEENRAKKRQISDPEDAVTSSKNFKRDEESVSNNTHYGSLVPDPTVVQYDVLNSTTCSPNSTVQSPLNNDLDNSISSPPVYHQYVPVQSTEVPYAMKVYPIDEKTVINRGFYEQTNVDPYVCDSVESMYPDPPKQNSIRSILTNGEAAMYQKEVNPQHVCEEIPSTSTNPDVNKARDILQDVERIEPNSMESILCEAIKLEFEAYSSVNSCSGSSRELNEVERAKLNELIVANKALHAPIDDDISQLIGDTAATAGLESGDGKHDPRLITIMNLTAVAIRRFIKMAKKINAFKNMCEEDQVVIKFSSPIKKAINSYYYLLRRYLESVYPGCEAKSTFLKLIQKILELKKFAEEITGVYLDVNPIEPLLMEIFDLKHHDV
ncbi:PREDICTED: nuclear hormone receptor family member nhr-8 [Papilio polytes]|uniref:nuclear hormone receptor family member nhr-8 n=1 Tax=Papilio polytes TaxID=76194 RepID=UPI00067635D9|nr:PREDICTED: nuclear hormone receptor family member nhr-8 [Papilio polytes]